MGTWKKLRGTFDAGTGAECGSIFHQRNADILRYARPNVAPAARYLCLATLRAPRSPGRDHSAELEDLWRFEDTRPGIDAGTERGYASCGTADDVFISAIATPGSNQ